MRSVQSSLIAKQSFYGSLNDYFWLLLGKFMHLHHVTDGVGEQVT